MTPADNRPPLCVTQESERSRAAPTIREIQEAVALQSGVSVDALRGQNRSRKVVRPRQVAMYLARDMTQCSTTQIGKVFGDRDHTTVSHAYRVIENLLHYGHGGVADLVKSTRGVLATNGAETPPAQARAAMREVFGKLTERLLRMAEADPAYVLMGLSQIARGSLPAAEDAQ